MDCVVLTKRGTVFQKIKRGEQMVLYVPARENIKIFKDVSDTSTIAERYGANNQAPLWREEQGQIVVYGTLPEEFSQRRQAMKVWLPHDFVPHNDTAFYFIMNDKLAIQGVRETDDEGRQGWRMSLLKTSKDSESIRNTLVSVISEQMLNDTESRVCVAVYDDVSLFTHIQDDLKAFSIQPVPLSILKPNLRVKPLYRQGDFSWVMVLSALMGLLVVAAMGAYWFVNYLQVSRLQNDVESVRRQILDVQINPRIGHVHSPEEMLSTMQTTFNQSPSVVLDAAAQFAIEFGELQRLEFDPANREGAALQQKLQPEEYVVRTELSKITNKLLVDQEKVAEILLRDRPWVRRVENNPAGGGELVLDIVLQIGKMVGDTP